MTLAQRFLSLALIFASTASPLWASDDHDHGDAPAAPTASAWPRFSAESAHFELVGVLDGRQLSLYLDHRADNRPIDSAALEVALDGVGLEVTQLAPGEYQASLAQAPAEGEIQIAARVSSGPQVESLTAELDIHGDTHEHSAHPTASNLPAWIIAALLALVLLIWAVRRARSASRNLQEQRP